VSAQTRDENRTTFLDSLSRLRRQNDQLSRTGTATGPKTAVEALNVAAKAVRTLRPETVSRTIEKPERAALEATKATVRVAANIVKPLAVVVKPVEKAAHAVQKNIDRSEGGRER
jgi:hypothetical protein